jgi:hypothetical protein
MLRAAPPYSLAAPTFPFRSIAALAGRAPLGGEREVAMAALMAGRLAAAMVPPHSVSREGRVARAAGARIWFSTLTLPAATRTPIARMLDATERDDPAVMAVALAELATVLGPMLDRGSKAELAAVVASLEKR